MIGDTSNFSRWTDEPEKSDEDESVFVHEPNSALCQVDIKPVQLQELEVVWVGAEEDIQRTTVPFSKYSEAATASSKQDYSVETEKIQETSESLDNYVEPVTTTAKVDATPSTQPKIRGDSVEQNGPVAAKEAQPKYLNIVPHMPTGRSEVKVVKEPESSTEEQAGSDNSLEPHAKQSLISPTGIWTWTGSWDQVQQIPHQTIMCWCYQKRVWTTYCPQWISLF